MSTTHLNVSQFLLDVESSKDVRSLNKLHDVLCRQLPAHKRQYFIGIINKKMELFYYQFYRETLYADE